MSSAENHAAVLRETATGRGLKRIVLPYGGAGAVAFSPDGKFFAVAVNYPPYRIEVWSADGKEKVHTLQGHDTAVTMLAFSPDGRRLASGMDNTTALVWELRR